MEGYWIPLLLLLAAVTGNTSSATSEEFNSTPGEFNSTTENLPKITSTLTTTTVNSNFTDTTDNNTVTASDSTNLNTTVTDLSTTTLSNTVSSFTASSSTVSSSSVSVTIVIDRNATDTTTKETSTFSLSTSIPVVSSSSSQTESSSKSPTTIYSSTKAVPASLLLPGVRISETNFLLTDSDSDIYFVEMKILDIVTTDVWLVILDGNMTSKADPLLQHKCNVSTARNNIYTYEANNVTAHKSRNLKSVLIALYVDEASSKNHTMDGLYDMLLYSSSGEINADLHEIFGEIASQNIVINQTIMEGLQAVSLSRCSPDEVANTAAVLTNRSLNEENFCNLTNKQSLEMKLTKQKEKDCASDLHPDFNNKLATSVITGVNSKIPCGFAFHMLSDMNIRPLCQGQVKEIFVAFIVSSAFPDQLTLIVNGYREFLLKPDLQVDGETFDLGDCDHDCFPKAAPSTKSDDDKIRVTVAVVVSCITIFLIVVLFVYLYLRRKKKGILQFSMTRLDEDDDLIGDMDDFVGNQGPTFRSFK